MNERDLVLDLEDQLAFLAASCEAYDRGMHIEAKRLAVTIRVMVYERGGKSLLRQMGVKERLKWASLGIVQPENLLPQNTLTWLQFGTDKNGAAAGSHIPVPAWYILQHADLVTFDDWWHLPVIRDVHGECFSREDLMIILAHKDGGAHVDKLKEPQRRLSHGASMGWSVGVADIPSTPAHLVDSQVVAMNPILAAVRTMAEELVLSLYNQRDLLGFPNFPGRDNTAQGHPQLPPPIDMHSIISASFRPATPAEIAEAEAASEGQ
jgi:hypothetical protein